MSAQPVVQVEDLDVYYGTSQIMFGVGLSVRPGETMALLGRNGAGKSTTMKAIMGLAPAVIASLQSGAAAAQQAWCARSGLACQQVLEAFKAGKP